MTHSRSEKVNIVERQDFEAHEDQVQYRPRVKVKKVKAKTVMK